jgi:hypothetical protein
MCGSYAASIRNHGIYTNLQKARMSPFHKMPSASAPAQRLLLLVIATHAASVHARAGRTGGSSSSSITCIGVQTWTNHTAFTEEFISAYPLDFETQGFRRHLRLVNVSLNENLQGEFPECLPTLYWQFDIDVSVLLFNRTLEESRPWKFMKSHWDLLSTVQGQDVIMPLYWKQGSWLPCEKCQMDVESKMVGFRVTNREREPGKPYLFTVVLFDSEQGVRRYHSVNGNTQADTRRMIAIGFGVVGILCTGFYACMMQLNESLSSDQRLLVAIFVLFAVSAPFIVLSMGILSDEIAMIIIGIVWICIPVGYMFFRGVYVGIIPWPKIQGLARNTAMKNIPQGQSKASVDAFFVDLSSFLQPDPARHYSVVGT